MSDSTHLREYRMNGRVSAAFFIPAGIGLVAASLPILLGGEVPAWISVPFLVLLLTLGAWATVALRRAGTFVSGEHILIRAAFKDKEVAWPDIQDIRIEEIPNTAEHGLPQQLVALYHRDGRRLGLPHLNEKALGGPQALHDEVYALREMWLLRRGDDWAPDPAVAAKLAAKAAKEADARQYALTPGQLALASMGCGFPLVMGVFLWLGLGTDVLDDIDENLLAFGVVGTIALVPVTVLLTTLVRRRRRRARGAR